MKATTTTPTPAKIRTLLKAIDMEFQAILEDDVRKLHNVDDKRIQEAAFLQLIAA